MYVPGVSRKSMKRNRRVALTPLGKQQADNYEGEGIEFDVKNHIAHHGASTPAEISRDLGIPLNKAEAVCSNLVRTQLARYVESGDDI